MPRFSENQPWHFGQSPSEYYEELCSERPEFERGFHGIDWEYMDGLHRLAISCPDVRDVAKEKLDRFSLDPSEGIEDKAYQLAITYCKPASFFRLYDEENVIKSNSALLDELGISYHISERKSNGQRVCSIAFSDEMMDGLQKALKGDQAFHLEMGISLGYPIGDVFGCHLFPDYFDWNFHSRYGVYHLVYASGWTRRYVEEVGKKGLAHLSAVYRKYAHIDG